MKNSITYIITLSVFVSFSSNVFCQKLENGIYISSKGGLITKYAILTIQKDSASIDIFSKWQGAWLPIIGSWDESYKPQTLKHSEPYKLINENIRVEKLKNNRIAGIVKNTFAGRIRFSFKKVEQLPKRYSKIKEKAMEFTKRK